MQKLFLSWDTINQLLFPELWMSFSGSLWPYLEDFSMFCSRFVSCLSSLLRVLSLSVRVCESLRGTLHLTHLIPFKQSQGGWTGLDTNDHLGGVSLNSSHENSGHNVFWPPAVSELRPHLEQYCFIRNSLPIYWYSSLTSTPFYRVTVWVDQF